MRNIKKSCAGRGHRHEVAGVWGGAQQGEAGGGWAPVAWHLRGRGASRSQCRVGGESDPVAVTLCGAAWLPREESRRRTVRKADALRQRQRVSAGKVEGSGV